MGFEWDEQKRLENLEAHKVDFADAALIFENPVIEAEDTRTDYGEGRIRALGTWAAIIILWCTQGAATIAGSSVHGR